MITRSGKATRQQKAHAEEGGGQIQFEKRGVSNIGGLD